MFNAFPTFIPTPEFELGLLEANANIELFKSIEEDTRSLQKFYKLIRDASLKSPLIPSSEELKAGNSNRDDFSDNKHVYDEEIIKENTKESFQLDVSDAICKDCFIDTEGLKNPNESKPRSKRFIFPSLVLWQLGELIDKAINEKNQKKKLIIS
jgi:hypothetical protein